MTSLPVNGAKQQESAAVVLDKPRALVNRLLAIVFLTLVVIAAAGLWLRYSEAAAAGRRNAENLVDVLSDYLVIRLGPVDGVLSRVVASSRRIGGPKGPEKEWASALRTAASGVAGLSAVVITDADGIVTHSTILQIAGMSWAEHAIFRRLSKGRSNLIVVEAPLAITGGDQTLIPFGRSLTDSGGAFIGTVVATLVPNQLQDFFQTFDLAQSGVISVLLPSGEILFREGSVGELGDTTAAARQWLVPDRTAAGDGFVQGPLVPGGQDYLTAYRTADISNLIVAVSLAENDFTSQWRYEALGVLVFLVIAGGSLLFARRRIDEALVEAVETARADEAASETDRSRISAA